MKVRAPEPDDAEVLLALSVAADETVAGESDWTEHEMRELLAEVDLTHDAWVVELDGAVAGYATVDVRHGGRVVSDGYVHPDARGRGVGTTLLRLIERRALEEPDERLVLINATLAGDPCTPNLYAANGYEAKRHLWFMTVELDGAPQTEGSGVALRPYEHPADAAAVHAAEQEAFRGHPRGLESYEIWAERHFDRSGFDPSLWHVATAGDEVAGYLISRSDGDGGYVEMVGVRPPWRSQGVGEALLRRALAEFARRGEKRVSLTVDSTNPTGATRLYERVGMRVVSETVVYEKVLRG